MCFLGSKATSKTWMEDGSRLRIDGNFWDGSRNSFLLRLFPIISQEIVHWSRLKSGVFWWLVSVTEYKRGADVPGWRYALYWHTVCVSACRWHESKSLKLSDSLCFIQQSVEHRWSLTGQKHINHLKKITKPKELHCWHTALLKLIIEPNCCDELLDYFLPTNTDWNATSTAESWMSECTMWSCLSNVYWKLQCPAVSMKYLSLFKSKNIFVTCLF